MRFLRFVLWLLLLTSAILVSGQSSDSFLEAELDTDVMYPGQAVTYTLRFYDAQPDRERRYQPPAFNGFGQSELDPLPPSTVQVNGQQMTLHTLETRLFPTRPGTMTIPPYQITLLETTTDTAQTLQSNPLTLEVLPLPDNAPVSFQGAIGQFDLRTTLEPDTVKTGEPITLIVEISGSGNHPQITAPALSLPDTWRSYPTMTETIQQTRQFSTRRFEFTLIPGAAGTFTLSPVLFSYFDPSGGNYVTRTGEAFVITVQPGDNSIEPPQTTDSPSSRSSILTLKPVPETVSSEFYPTMAFWLLWLIPPGIVLLASFVMMSITPRTQSEQSSRQTMKRSRALRHTLRQLKALQHVEPAQASRDLHTAILVYLSTKTGSDVTTATLSDSIDSLPEPLQQALITCIEQAHNAQYALLTQRDVRHLLTQTISVLKDVDQHLS